MNPVGAGLLQAFGNLGVGVGGAFDQARKDALEREKLEQERNLRQQVIDAQAEQFKATQAAAERDKYSQMTDLAALAQQIGLKLPDTMGPSAARFPTAWGPEILKEASARQKVQQEQALRGQQADVLERLGAGTPAGPAQLAGQLAEGEDPEAAALIPRTQTPATPANARYQAIAGLLRQGPLSEYLVKALDEEHQKALVVSEGGSVWDPRTKTFQTPPGAAVPGPAAPPADRPGFQWVQALDKNNRPTWREEPIGSGTDLDGEARARGYASYAAAPEAVRLEVKRYSDEKALRNSRGQGADAVTTRAQAERNLPLAQSNLHGGMVWDRQQNRPADPLNVTMEDARRDPIRYIVIDKDKQLPQITAIGEGKILLSQFVPLVQGLTNQPGANFAQAAEMWAKTKAGVDNPGVAFDAMKGTILRMAGAMQGSRVQLSDQDRKAVEGMLPTPMDTAQTGMKRLQTVMRILDSMEAALIGDTTAITQANLLLRQIGGSGTLGGMTIPSPSATPTLPASGGGWSIKRVQ